MAKHIINVFSPSASQTILVFFHTKRDGNIPTRTLLTDARGVKKYDFQPISRFIAEMMQDRAKVTMEGE